ncbi:hypothetical protein AC579_1913 [Pseudocercospora musae]|uniref:Uncharacterized protein n=1 Tax=Pseudocercospora musae TaxID=113226 RepID=A0A139HFK4_9PEZI|nr:hypothetical protein AC579_1913 [Pseudocercospora musae]
MPTSDRALQVAQPEVYDELAVVGIQAWREDGMSPPLCLAEYDLASSGNCMIRLTIDGTTCYAATFTRLL